jgi:hypothetical protein
VVAPEVVAAVAAAAAAMAAYSCSDMTSAVAAAWTLVMAVAKSNGATPEAAEAMVMVSGSMTDGV